MTSGVERVAEAIYPYIMNTWEDQWPLWPWADEQVADFMREVARVALAVIERPSGEA